MWLSPWALGMKIDNRLVFDISPEVSADTAVFPGDTEFSQKILMDCSKGDNIGLSSFTSTPHIGAHTDAPNHYHADGVGISQRRLDYYMGSCQVIAVTIARGERVRLKDFASKNILAPRVLFKTLSFPNPNQWNGDFNALSGEVIDELARQGVRLVGIDTPSIDPADDQKLESHHRVQIHDMAILEGIVLDQVPEGLYELIALPLKLKNMDASPVRAVLVGL